MATFTSTTRRYYSFVMVNRPFRTPSSQWRSMVLKLQQADVSRCPEEVQKKWHELTQAMTKVYTTQENRASMGEGFLVSFIEGLLTGGPGQATRTVQERDVAADSALRNMKRLWDEMDLLFLKYIK